MAGRVQGLLRGLTASRTEFEAVQERRRTQRSGCCPVDQAEDRHRVTVAGVLRSVTLRSRQTVPALEAELYDGTGALRLVWLGRREIPGIHPGRRLRVTGMVSEDGGTATMYNPRYELLADDG
ncbi:MAG: OB-fold nucleic acid binding domain-containing protein [Actinotalea sp.]|nr:OB-fold nucleic acid binding domain-containing protein [Actinotalea sp.]